MRILDEKDFELNPDEIDYELGYLTPDSIFIAHHEAEPEEPEVNHLEVTTFYFEDGSKLVVDSPDDPHIITIDNKSGKFDYKNLPGEKEKTVRGIDLKSVVDIPRKEAKEAWDETESIQRYILFTPEELAEQKAQKEKQERESTFLATGPERLDDAEVSVEDLTLMVAEMMGV